jgi:predicted ATPase
MEQPVERLARVEIAGFKSIRQTSLELRPINVLIGANGAGKSNLVSFFKMVGSMMTRNLQLFVAKSGYAPSLLRFGPKITPEIEATFAYHTREGSNTYLMRLVHAAGDTLIFADESLAFQRAGSSTLRRISLGAGHKESLLPGAAPTHKMAEVARFCMSRYRVFQFHDTSESARIRGKGDIENSGFLMADAGNLAAVLYRLKSSQPTYYDRIVSTIRQIAPFFDDFVLAPDRDNPAMIALRWKQTDSEYDFGPHQLSDGTLRTMALITLLLQPEADLPALVVLDEPELGLHPYAVTVIGGLIRAAALGRQFILATQSTAFLDQFDIEDVVVVEQRQGASVFERRSADQLKEWREAYSLSELWEKNVLGGRPAP